MSGLSISLSRGLLLVQTLVLLPVVVVGIGIVTTQIDRENKEERSLEQSTLLHAEIGASQFERIVNDAETLLGSLASHPTLLTADFHECNEHLVSTTAAHPVYSDILAVLPDGQVVCDGAGLDGPLNLSDRSYFQQALATGGFAMSEYLIGRVTGEAILAVAYPVHDGTGDIAEVLTAGIRLASLEAAFEQAILPDGSTIAIVGGDGKTLMTIPRLPEEIGTLYGEADVLAAIQKRGESVVKAKGQDGVDRHYGLASLIGNDDTAQAYVVVGVPSQEVGRLQNPALLGGVGLLIGLSAMFFGTWAILRFAVRRPLANIAETAHLFASGDTQARIGPPYPAGEIGALGQSLDEVRVRIGSSMTELVQAKEEAEQAHRETAALNTTIQSQLNTLFERLRSITNVEQQALSEDMTVGELRSHHEKLLQEVSTIVE